ACWQSTFLKSLGEEARMSEMHDLNDMYLFAKVIEHGGFTAASRALGVATSKLSRRISELERQLGVHLVNRSSRSISLSDTGQTFYQHCLSMVREPTPRLATDDLAMLRTAALEGIGIAMLPDCMLRKELADGSL